MPPKKRQAATKNTKKRVTEDVSEMETDLRVEADPNATKTRRDGPFIISGERESMVYDKITQMDIRPPKKLKMSDLYFLQLEERVVEYLRALRLYQYATMEQDAVIAVIMEFYTTLTVLDKDKRLACRLQGKEVTIDYALMNEIFGFPKTGPSEVPSGHLITRIADHFDLVYGEETVHVKWIDSRELISSHIAMDSSTLHPHESRECVMNYFKRHNLAGAEKVAIEGAPPKTLDLPSLEGPQPTTETANDVPSMSGYTTNPWDGFAAHVTTLLNQ
ncbi:UDP-Glycosyltransferase superfamily protein, partial [Striga asiatica]